jgi:D-tyrosyl-tRNA(Tyr) deacylase
MSSNKDAVVCLMCDDLEKDPVGPRVADLLTKERDTEPTGIDVDGRPVLATTSHAGIPMFLVRTEDVISHDYPHYLPILNQHFGDVAAAVVVNWHAGANAPERVLTAHSNGDVDSGTWAPSDPRHLRNLLLALEEQRRAEGLDDFTVTVEGTHWSGIAYGGDPALVPQYGVPVYDVEIGSEPTSWSNPAAVRAIAGAVEHVVDDTSDGRVISVLAGGGVHCELGFSRPVLTAPDAYPLALSHILPNQWLVSGGYDTESADARLDACVASIAGGVDVIVVHEKLKATYKDAFRRLGERLGVRVVKHKVLMRPDELL